MVNIEVKQCIERKQYMKYDLSEEEVEKIRQLAIASAMQKFGWSIEECEARLGKDISAFLRKVNLVDNKLI